MTKGDCQLSIRINILPSIVVTTFLTAAVTGLISISGAKSLTSDADKRSISEANGTFLWLYERHVEQHPDGGDPDGF
jgi:hypothetical protein